MYIFGINTDLRDAAAGCNWLAKIDQRGGNEDKAHIDAEPQHERLWQAVFSDATVKIAGVSMTW